MHITVLCSLLSHAHRLPSVTPLVPEQGIRLLEAGPRQPQRALRRAASAQLQGPLQSTAWGLQEAWGGDEVGIRGQHSSRTQGETLPSFGRCRGSFTAEMGCQGQRPALSPAGGLCWCCKLGRQACEEVWACVTRAGPRARPQTSPAPHGHPCCRPYIPLLAAAFTHSPLSSLTHIHS